MLYSGAISETVKSGGPHAAKTSAVKAMRAVKKAALRLVETFVDKCEDVDLVATQFVPAILARCACLLRKAGRAVAEVAGLELRLQARSKQNAVQPGVEAAEQPLGGPTA